MRKIIVHTFVSLDGVMQAPGAPEEDPTGGFEHGGWLVPLWEDAIGEELTDPSQEVALLLGRGTYEIFAAHWGHVGDEDPIAKQFNRATKYVASRTLTTLGWAGSKLLGEDVPAELATLKRGEGPDLHVHGSAGLLQTLFAHDLVDEVRVAIFPVVLGKGKRLFGEGTQARILKLVSSKTTKGGTTVSTYTFDGPVKQGSFALETPTDEEVARRAALKK